MNHQTKFVRNARDSNLLECKHSNRRHPRTADSDEMNPFLLLLLLLLVPVISRRIAVDRQTIRFHLQNSAAGTKAATGKRTPEREAASRVFRGDPMGFRPRNGRRAAVGHGQQRMGLHRESARKKIFVFTPFI